MLFIKTFKLVLIVRTDLAMKKGKIAAQCCHAAVASYRNALSNSPKVLSRWEAAGEPKVVLRCSSEEELLALMASAQAQQLPSVLVRDAGRTQVAAGTPTALGVGPAQEERLDQVFGHLKLL